MGYVGQHSVEELVSVTFSMYICSLHVDHEKILQFLPITVVKIYNGHNHLIVPN